MAIGTPDVLDGKVECLPSHPTLDSTMAAQRGTLPSLRRAAKTAKHRLVVNT